MKLKTSELDGAVLDWAAAKCEFPEAHTKDVEVWIQPLSCDDPADFAFEPSTNWSQGGPIIERECIALEKDPRYSDAIWVAEIPFNGQYSGPTPLIAAMRCYVASRLGDEVDVPDDLLEVA